MAPKWNVKFVLPPLIGFFASVLMAPKWNVKADTFQERYFRPPVLMAPKWNVKDIPHLHCLNMYWY